MSNSKIMSQVSTSFKFVGEKVSTNLVEYLRRESIDLSDPQIKGMLSIVESSVDQAFSLTCESIEKSLASKEHTNDRYKTSDSMSLCFTPIQKDE